MANGKFKTSLRLMTVAVSIGLLPLPALATSTLRLFENITLESLPVAETSGSIRIDGLREIEWNAGDRPADYFPVGLIGEAGLYDMTLNEIASSSGLDLSQVSLSAFEPMQWLTIGDLEAVPQLSNYKVKDVQPILDTVGEDYQDELIGNLSGQLKGYLIQNLDQYPITAIPNLSQTELGKLRQTDYAKVSGIPGLSRVPLSQLEGYASPLVWGKMDLPLGELEANRSNAITGAYGHDRQWKTHATCQEKCRHAELDNKTPGIPLKGKLFVDMSTYVPGGWGVLVGVGGGKEPTGRHPAGKFFKYVIEVDDQAEAKGRVKSWMLWRYCQREPFTGQKIGCTPYGVQKGLAKTPFFPIKEGGTLPIGAEGLTEAIAQDTTTQVLTSAASTPAATDANTASPPGQTPPDSTTPEPTQDPKAPCPSHRIAPAKGYRVTSEFAARRNCSVCSKLHQGTDIGTPTGTALKASQTGVVEFAGISPSRPRNGLYLAVQACDGHRYLYLHLDQVAVQPGDRIEQGVVIARSGGRPGLQKSGSSTGPHLHIHVYPPQSTVAMNPRKYMPVN